MDLLDKQIEALEAQKSMEKETNADEKQRLVIEAERRKAALEKTMHDNMAHYAQARHALQQSRDVAVANLQSVVDQGKKDLDSIGFA
jgi:L-lactate utilization protein LutB